MILQAISWMKGASPQGDLNTSADNGVPARAPSIGLALGSGSARGFAHIGVLRVLREAGYDVNVLAGTSIGAVVGGCFCAGRLDQVEEWARSLTKRRVFGLLDFSLGGKGLIGGSRLGALLVRELGSTTIEDLPIPFAAVATEIGAGHEIWLTQGNLVRAIQASYALPGVFEPIRIGGRWLMDGALVNPIPVSTARALGGRVVIAVNLNGELTGRGAVLPFLKHSKDGPKGEVLTPNDAHARASARQAYSPRISAVMADAFNITQDRISRSRLAGDPPDVMIIPRLGRIGLFEFHRAAEIIEIGAEATRRSLERIAEAVEALA